MEMSAVLQKNDGFTVRTMGEETLFLDLNGAEIHVSDEVGSFIYAQIDGTKPLSEILKAILETYEVSEKTAGSDLEIFAGELVARKIAGVRR